MELVGLARTPRRIAEPLSAAAAATASAAAELYALTRGSGDRLALEHAVEEVRSLARRVVDEASHMLGGGLDRGDVLAMALAQKDVADSLEEAAGAIRSAGRGERASSVAGVVRDSARELAAAVRRLDGTRDQRDPHLDRLDALDAEGRRLLRLARAHALTSDADVMSALSGDELYQRLEEVLVACRRARRAIRLVVVKHA